MRSHTPRRSGRDAWHQRAVVGILGATLYNPVWTSAVLMPRDFAGAHGLPATHRLEDAPWIVVVLLAAADTLSALA